MASGAGASRNVQRYSLQLDRAGVKSFAAFLQEWAGKDSDHNRLINLEVTPDRDRLSSGGAAPDTQAPPAITLSVPESVLCQTLGGTWLERFSPGHVAEAGSLAGASAPSPYPRRQLNVLGRFQLLVNGELQDLQGRNRGKAARTDAQKLLAYVGHMQSRSVARPTLLDHLWPECAGDEEAQNRRFRHALSTVTDWLYPGSSHQSRNIVLDRNGLDGLVSVSPGLHLDVDADCFERLAREALRPPAGASPSAEAANKGQQALQLYHGGYMASAPFASLYPSAAGMSPWWKLRHDRLQAMACDLTFMTATFHQNHQDLDKAVELLYAIVESEDLPFEPLARASQMLATLLKHLHRDTELVILKRFVATQYEIKV